jgi:hypothetical protein
MNNNTDDLDRMIKLYHKWRVFLVDKFKILISCEKSGRVRDAFIKKGFTNTISCDIQESTSKLGRHCQCDVSKLLSIPWDLVVAFPPCTYLCNSGVRWLHTEYSRWPKMVEGALFFVKHFGFKTKLLAIENPILHKYAMEIINRPYSQIIQPWQFGHGETKATCLWLKGLPLLKPTNIVEGREHRIHLLGGGVINSEIRSLTYQGVATAMAEQWGNFLRGSYG